MKKNVKLPRKQAPEQPQREKFYFFVKNQGEGASAVLVIILKVLELIVTSIFALCLGVFGPLCIWFGFDDPDISSNPAVTAWLVSSVIYIVGTFIVMLGHSKIACAVHIAGFAGSMVTYYLYSAMFADIPDNNGPTVLYMPCIALTVFTVIIMLLINLPIWIEKKVARENAVAPSILLDRPDDKED